MSVAPRSDQTTAAQMLSALSTESGRHVRFAERTSLARLSAPTASPTVLRALTAIAALESSHESQTPKTHFKELQQSFTGLADAERIVAAAFTDRALRKLSDRNLLKHLHQRYLWGIVATGAADTVVSLFRVVNGAEFDLAPVVYRDAALALSCHKSPNGFSLALRTINGLDREGLSSKQRDSIISGLASGATLRVAHLVSMASTTGSFPKNDSSPNGKFHHVALMKEMVKQTLCPTLRHRVIDEIGSITHPFYLWNHPLMPATLEPPAMLRLPQFLMDVIRMAVDYPDHIAQRKAVQAVRSTYRDGVGAEGEFVKDVLAYRIGGPAARMEAESFMGHFPKTHVREVMAEARRRKRSI